VGRGQAREAVEHAADIEAVQFVEDPEPDFVGRTPEELPY